MVDLPIPHRAALHCSAWIAAQLRDTRRMSFVTIPKEQFMQEIQWRYYPHVAENPITRAFIESQAKRQKRPKTVDAYARNVEDLIKAFTDFGFPDLIEATPDQMETYLESLYYRTPARPRYNIIPLSRNTLSLGTIQQ